MQLGGDFKRLNLEGKEGKSCEVLNIFCVWDVAEWGLANQQICSICFLERGGKAAPNPQNKPLKNEKQKDKDSWQVLGFRNPAEKARVK